MYSPQSDISLNLLHSIPKKIMLWLQSVGVTSNFGKIGHIFYNFPKDKNNSYVVIDTSDGEIRIEWKMDIHSTDGTVGSHVYFLDLENHLDWFVQLEKTVYDDLEMLNQLIDSNSLNYKIDKNKNA